MSIHKDNATGKWRVVYCYTDWTGETHQSSKRGFSTKATAEERGQTGYDLRKLLRDLCGGYAKSNS